MSIFSTANTFHMPEPFDRNEAMTPTTPRPNTAPSSHHQVPRMDDSTTPTRANFGSLANQRPLPATSSMSLPTIAKAESAQAPARQETTAPSNSKRSHDVDMDESEDGGDDGSDDGSVNPDGSKSSKKKKGQKFYCTDYPPCNLSFTRSEHLARHIRKHTGERPFQCHCSRRFSRLDNLRQHAQTVHVNEEIPPESLAATGTRFQRQVRTERQRPMGNRSRASTVGSQSSGGRGHHRNSLSASSIGSITSTYSQRDDPRRRPPPLPLASDPRARLSLETYNNFRPGSPSGQFYRPASPGGFGTPTSGGQNSPRWSGIQSPSSNHSRTQSLYSNNGSRTPGRRLSVPSGANPFQSYPSAYGQPQMSPLNSSNSAIFPILPSNAPNSMASPTSSNSGSSWSRRESVASMVEGDWRRRTWHSDTHTNFTSSRLNVVTTPNQYQTPPQAPQVYQYPPPPPPPPAFTLASQNTPPQTTRLPGIESFDPFRPQTPSRRDDSPMIMDTPSRHAAQVMETYRQDDQQPPQVDRSLNQNLSGLELVPGARSQDSAHIWASEAERAVQEQAEQVRSSQPTVRFEQPIAYHQPQYATVHPQHVSAPPITPRSDKRSGWYNGPIKSNDRGQGSSTTESSSPEGIPGTPQSSNVSDYNGAVNAIAWVDPGQQMHHMQDPRTIQFQFPPQVSASQFQAYAAPTSENYTYVQNGADHNPANANGNRENHAHAANNDMDRLQTLVAVATSENTATSAY